MDPKTAPCAPLSPQQPQQPQPQSTLPPSGATPPGENRPEEPWSAAAEQAANMGLRRAWRLLSLVWLLVCIASSLWLWHVWGNERIDANILALLPQERSEQAINAVTARVADSGASQIVTLLGDTSAEGVRAAQKAYKNSLLDQSRRQDSQGRSPAQDGVILSLAPDDAQPGLQWFNQAQAFFEPYRDRLLTAQQRETLTKAPVSALSAKALKSLYGPMGAPRLTEWRADPLGLWLGWWQERAQEGAPHMDEQGLIAYEGRVWTVMLLNTSRPTFHLDGKRRIEALLDAAAAAARKASPNMREIRAGVPLHAEAAAAHAALEINIIGWGSIAAVLALTIFAFGSLWPRVLVILSLLTGCLSALAVTLLVFGKVHLITLVFGTSLIGVAEDYGTYWFTSFLSRPDQSSWSLLRRLWLGLVLALATSALAYAAMGLISVPGLQQIAVFSATGLTAAFLTVLLWFPWLDRGARRSTAFARWVSGSLQYVHRLRLNKLGVAAIVLALALMCWGLSLLKVQDSLLSLQSSPRALIEQQMEASKILQLPSPAQFFLIQGPDEQAVLEREEALTDKLRDAKAQGFIGGWRAVSDWLPSNKRQRSDAALSAKVEKAVLARVGQAVGETLTRSDFPVADMNRATFFASPVSLPVRPLWIGPLPGGNMASIVLITGLAGRAHLSDLQAAAQDLPGVRWVDRTADFSLLLGRYRITMTYLLIAGTVVVLLVLALRYRRRAWRALLPTALAGLIALSALGFIGERLQLFDILALMLLLGIGVDYGIFMLEQDSAPHAWLAVSLGAASTSLSFGLLSLSATPALHAFGLTLLIGLLAVWILTPLICKRTQT